MNDEDLLGYFEIHSRTELALFHRKMVERLLTLAGEDPNEWLLYSPRGFVPIHSDTADPLVKRARERMDADNARFALIAAFIPEDEARREVAIRMSLGQLARHAYEHHEHHHEELNRIGRPLTTLLTLVRGIPSVSALLKHLEETGGWIPSCDWEPSADTVEKRAEALLKTLDGTYPSREMTREELELL